MNAIIDEQALDILKQTNFFGRLRKSKSIGISNDDFLRYTATECEKECEKLVNTNWLPKNIKERHTIYRKLYKEGKNSNSRFFRWATSVIDFAEQNHLKVEGSREIIFQK